MADFPTFTERADRVTIWTGGVESCGSEINACAITTASTVWTAASTAVFVPFVVSRPLTVVKMFALNGAAVSGNCDIGIYDDQQNRLVSIGSTAQAGTSAIQSFDVTDTLLLPGAYFMAYNLDNTTGRNNGFAFSSVATRGWGVFQQAVGAVALPDPATFAHLTDAATILIPNIGLTARTVV